MADAGLYQYRLPSGQTTLIGDPTLNKGMLAGATFVGQQGNPTATDPLAAHSALPGASTSPSAILPGAGTPPPDMPSPGAVSGATAQLSRTPADIASSALSFEDAVVQRSQGIIDTIEKSFNSVISQAGGNAASASAASGFAGSPQSGEMTANAEEPYIEQRAAAVSKAIEDIRNQAASDYQQYESMGTTNAENTITAYQTGQANLVKTATSLFSTGVTPDELKSSNPQEYTYLLQNAYNNDPNAMNAAYAAAAKSTLMNSGQPIYQSGGTMVFARMTGVNADGTPNIQFIPVTSGNIPPGYKMQSNNQTSQGQVITTFAPTDSNGNVILDPSKPNGGVITMLNGQEIGGAGSNPNVNPILSGQTIGSTTLGVVPNGVSQANALAAQAVIEGKAPPPSSSTGSIASNAANQQMRAYMEANGYDLTKATEDWTAVQKWTNTENSATVVRARVAADSAQQYITTLRGLAQQWNQTDPVHVLNHVNFQAALNGAYGQTQQNIAQQVQTQIADLTSDMGSVYRYGLSSTDSSMEQATKTLSTDWNGGELNASLDIISQNLQVRINSLNSPQNAVSATGDAGGSNPYIGGTDSGTPGGGGSASAFIDSSFWGQ